jgi:hypothetical protein
MGFICNGYVKVRGRKYDLEAFVEDRMRLETLKMSEIDTSSIDSNFILWKWQAANIDPRSIVLPVVNNHDKLLFEVAVLIPQKGLYSEQTYYQGKIAAVTAHEVTIPESDLMDIRWIEVSSPYPDSIISTDFSSTNMKAELIYENKEVV